MSFVTVYVVFDFNGYLITFIIDIETVSLDDLRPPKRPHPLAHTFSLHRTRSIVFYPLLMIHPQLSATTNISTLSRLKAIETEVRYLRNVVRFVHTLFRLGLY